MQIELFFVSLALTLTIVMLPMLYLRPVTRSVLMELCDRSEISAEFWLRTANVLALCGSLMLVLMFGKTNGDWVDAVRITLILALIGVFITVMFVSSNIWRRVSTAANAATNATLPTAPKAV